MFKYTKILSSIALIGQVVSSEFHEVKTFDDGSKLYARDDGVTMMVDHDRAVITSPSNNANSETTTLDDLFFESCSIERSFNMFYVFSEAGIPIDDAKRNECLKKANEIIKFLQVVKIEYDCSKFFCSFIARMYRDYKDYFDKSIDLIDIFRKINPGKDVNKELDLASGDIGRLFYSCVKTPSFGYNVTPKNKMIECIINLSDILSQVSFEDDIEKNKMIQAINYSLKRFLKFYDEEIQAKDDTIFKDTCGRVFCALLEGMLKDHKDSLDPSIDVRSILEVLYQNTNIDVLISSVSGRLYKLIEKWLYTRP